MRGRARTGPLLDRWKATHRLVYQLARLCSPAARIEPALIRAVRIGLLPRADASTEADLWFSPFVKFRSSQGIVLDPAVIEVLREDLAGDAPLFERACALIAEAHRHLPDLVTLEERLIHLAFSTGTTDEPIERELSAVARAMTAPPPAAEQVSTWFLRALPHLPARIRKSPTAWALALSAGARLRISPALDGEAPRDAVRAFKPGLLPEGMGDTEVGVERRGDVLFVGLPVTDRTRLELPDTEPRVLEIEESDGARQVVTFRAGEQKPVPVKGPTLTLRTLRGRAIKVVPAEAPEEQAESLARKATVLILTALPIEFAAVRALLDNPVDLPEGSAPGASACAIGEIPTATGKHTVIVWQARRGTPGVAALARFPAPKVLLSVGLAGGLPASESRAEPVLLGDVVVAARLETLAFSLDTGRLEVSAARGGPQPNRHLLAAAAEIEADRSKWSAEIERAILRTRVYHLDAPPPPLREDTYPLVEGDESSDPPRTKGVPRIHFGTVASAKVPLSGEHDRDDLRDRFSVKAVQVDDLGLAMGPPLPPGVAFLVICGIADDAGRNEDSTSQPYAAAMAAATARALLERVQPEDLAGIADDDEGPSEPTDVVPNNLPPRVTFVGREGLLAHLEDLFKEPSARQVTLFGLEGAGKVAVALEYAHRSMPRYPGGVWWVDASRRPEEALAALAIPLREKGPEPIRSLLSRTAEDSAAIAAAVERALASGEEPTLVVLADIRAPEWSRHLPQGRLHTLATTLGSSLGPGAKVRVGPLPHDEAIALAESLAGPVVDQEERAALDRVIVECDALPSTVAHAARAIGRHYKTWSACAAEIERDPWRLLDDHRFVVATARNTPKELLDFSLAPVRRGGLAWEVAQGIAVFAPLALPIAWALGAAGVGETESALEAIDTLADLGLLELDRGRNTVTILRLVRRLVRERAAESESWLTCRANAVRTVVQWLEEPIDAAQRSAFMPLGPHLDEAMVAARRSNNPVLEARFLSGLARYRFSTLPAPGATRGELNYLQERRRLQEAYEMGARAVKLAEPYAPVERELLSTILERHAAVARELGRTREAESLLQRISQIQGEAEAPAEAFSTPEWLDRDAWSELRTAFERRQLVVFAGTGVSVAGGLPSWPELAAKLIDRMRTGGKHDDDANEAQESLKRGRLVEALSAAQHALGPAELGVVVAESLDDRTKPIPELAHAIAALRDQLHGVVTTNLDWFLERAGQGEWSTTVAPTEDLVSRAGFLWKAHGTLQDRSTWVFARPAFERVMFGDPHYRAMFATLYLTHPFLFVGCSFTEDELDFTLGEARLLSAEHPPTHFAVLEAPVAAHRRRTLEQAGIRILVYPKGQHDEVPRLLRALGERPAPPREPHAA